MREFEPKLSMTGFYQPGDGTRYFFSVTFAYDTYYVSCLNDRMENTFLIYDDFTLYKSLNPIYNPCTLKAAIGFAKRFSVSIYKPEPNDVREDLEVFLDDPYPSAIEYEYLHAAGRTIARAYISLAHNYKDAVEINDTLTKLLDKATNV